MEITTELSNEILPSTILRQQAKNVTQMFGTLQIDNRLCALGVITQYIDPNKTCNPYKLLEYVYRDNPAFQKVKEQGYVECPFKNKHNEEYNVSCISELIWHMNDDHRLNFQEVANELEDVMRRLV